MTGDERREQLLFYAAGQLDPAEEAALRAHLSQATPEEIGALAEGQAVVAQLLMSLPPVAPSAQARERLLKSLVVPMKPASSSSTIAPAIAAVSQTSSKSPTSTRGFWLPLLTAIAAGLAIGVGITWYNDRTVQRNHATALEGEIARLDNERKTALADAIGLKAMNAALQKSAEPLHAEDVKLVSLSGKESNAVANVFWDRSHEKWTVSVFKLTPLPPDKVYELWFITKDGKPVAAGDLAVNDKGEGVTTIPVPENMQLAAAGITTEPRGVPHNAPSPPIHLSGAVQ